MAEVAIGVGDGVDNGEAVTTGELVPTVAGVGDADAAPAVGIGGTYKVGTSDGIAVGPAACGNGVGVEFCWRYK